MAIVRTMDGLVCEDCGSDRAGYLCGTCQEMVCSCSNHDCPVIQEQEMMAQQMYEQQEYEREDMERRHEEEWRDFR